MRSAFAATLALRAEGLLADFNRAGILTAADVHVATRLGALGGESDEAVLLALALVVRSTRHGSVVLDLDTAEATTSPDEDRDGDRDDGPPDADSVLAWPENWQARCAASPLVGGPLRMLGPRVWLARYWDQEEQVARELLQRSTELPDDIDLDLLAAGIGRLFEPGDDDDQRLAAAVCALSRVSVLAGGPGTGKTTTVARMLALLREQHPGCRIALAAPTGKAAARLEEAVRSSTAALPAEDRARLGQLSAMTLHRLLGWRPQARNRFRHDRSNRLPMEAVVVDESSMVSLTLWRACSKPSVHRPAWCSWAIPTSSRQWRRARSWVTSSTTPPSVDGLRRWQPGWVPWYRWSRSRSSPPPPRHWCATAYRRSR